MPIKLRWRFVLCLSFALEGCASSAAVPAFSAALVTAAPPRDAGIRSVREFFAAYSTGDVQSFVRVMRAELSGQVPRDESRLAARFFELQRQFGKLALHDIALDERGVRALARSEHEGWLRFDFFFEAVAPHKLTGQRLRPANAPGQEAPAPAPQIDDEELASTLRSYVKDRTARGLFSGSVLVARGDKVIFDERHARPPSL